MLTDLHSEEFSKTENKLRRRGDLFNNTPLSFIVYPTYFHECPMLGKNNSEY